MSAEQPSNARVRPSGRPRASGRRVTFSQICEIIPTREERIIIMEQDNDVTFPLIAFFVAFFLPFVGCIAYALCKDSRRDSPRYYWANRALQVGTALSILYSFAICSVMQYYALYYKPGDVMVLYYQ
ncbi:uncharacterized protein BXIN_0620 [Babesia sp. Xinjiang]|uniref:uncharacterized protein n=1 Tax=Babesia sp. Xinjiang TaxID=462227 RepID=UPI000A253F58|nr:uncharacterized protein BXIN_0620 [Babesia sp. Xinjiang]ORM41815.1 hypothetical protein BXIN_0620 [Babesia sp. Xinjiang]